MVLLQTGRQLFSKPVAALWHFFKLAGGFFKLDGGIDMNSTFESKERHRKQ
jgi:hypothetical protein